MDSIIVSKKFLNDKNKNLYDYSVDQNTGKMTVKTKSGKEYYITGYTDNVGPSFKMNGKEFNDLNDAIDTIKEEIKCFNY